ncbi:stalk domain-containing protein [Brevibacillus sp. H7]|uniref:stalk domain-containing protein n=1 Tax=Brevibacillus sp. H7 TaxID=3349138 RepID=UPI0038284441
MKRTKSWAWVIAMLLLLATPASAGADTHVLVTVNGHVSQLKHPSLLVNSRTYISAEDVVNLMHGSWKVNGNTVVLQLRAKTLSFKTSRSEAAVGSQWTKIDQGAILHNKVIYLPMRWVFEQAGLKVEWNSQDRMVTIVAPEEYDAIKLVTRDELTPEEQIFVNEVKKTKGIHRKGNLYVIARGESPNPGYGLKVAGTEQSWEQVKVYVKLTKPEPGLMYPQVIAYPYLMARIDLPLYTTVRFLNADTKKPLFEE